MNREEADALCAFATAFWWVIGGPGSASWRAGFGVTKSEYPTRFYLVRVTR